ncbi:MFS transporter [Stomatohabitans albus]|uniref:MFS transporter n=1 Tax=Stomatohabitans albus TaxID=3110766 RepID=UPI00300CA8BD
MVLLRSALNDYRAFRALPPHLQLTIITSFVFNCGFFLVIPFLASHMKDDLAFAGALVGVVLGVRTFAQQGMFFFGGMLADRFGIKPSLLMGCVIRILGFLFLGFAVEPVGMITGAVLTGLAGALFTPAIESAVSTWAHEVETSGGITRKETWGIYAVFSQMGSVVGPGLGAILFGVPFPLVCTIACGAFFVMFVLLALKLPRHIEGLEYSNPLDSIRAITANRVFIIFAIINASFLITYNQLYLALPADISRQGMPGGLIAWYFGLASVISILGQMPLARLAIAKGFRTTLVRAYVIMAAAFLPLLAVSPFAGHGEWFQALPAIAMVILLHIGFMLSAPMTRDLTAVLARERHVATHMGVVGTMGGIGVLVSSTITGSLLEYTTEPSLLSVIPWIGCMVFPICSAIAFSFFPFPESEPTN